MNLKITNVFLSTVFILLSLAALELGFRAWSGVNVFSVQSFRPANGIQGLMGTVAYDAELGWIAVPNAELEFGVPGHKDYYTMNTMAFGVRKNGLGDDEIRTGGVLAVGDSFTAGSEVSDAATWPSQLENLSGQPVVNAGAGGFGTDQIILRAHKLLPIVKPHTLIVGMLDQDILRAGYSAFGAPKPYYEIKEGKLALRNSPVPETGHKEFKENFVFDVLGYSFVIDQIMRSIAPLSWLGATGQKFTRVGNDEVEVTCLLLKQLKQKTEALNIRTFLVMQYGGAYVSTASKPSAIGVAVGKCASTMGYQVIDEFDLLKTIAVADPDRFKTFYKLHGTSWGHMSEAGNGQIAAMIAAAFKQSARAGRANDYQPSSFVPGDGKNLLSSYGTLSGFLSSSAIATIEQVVGSSFDQPSFRVSAKGAKGEHYLVSKVIDIQPGPYTLSFEAAPDGTKYIRAQLLDTIGNGVVGDINLAAASLNTIRVGQTKSIRSGTSDAKSGWKRLWFGATFPGGKARILIGIRGVDGATGFQPSGEAFQIRAMQLERGQSPSEYRVP